MAEVTYPIHCYKNLCVPRYAHTRKEFEALQLEGWTDVRANIGPQEYPKRLYSADGDTTVIGHFNKEGVVDLQAAKEAESDLLADGWSATPVAKKEVSEVANTGIHHALTTSGPRLDALESDMASMKNTLSEILSALQMSKRSPGRPPKELVEV